MEEDIKGKFVIRTKGKGIKYKLYVPDNVNEDTPVFVYAYGSGDPNMEKCIAEHGSDSIVIGTIIDYKADIGKLTMDIVNEVKDEYGVSSTIVSPSGFSLGGPVGLKVAAENIRRNPDCEPQTVFFVDGYGTYFYNPKLHLNDTDTMNLFKENNTVFFAFDHPDKKTNVNTLYAEAGLNFIMVKCVGQGHGEINSSFFANGLYDYRANERLPKDGYVYSIYNKEKGAWEEIPYEKVETLANIYELFGIEYNGNIEHKYTIEEMANLEDLDVRSSDSALATLLNGIRSAIRNSSIVNKGYASSGCSSTTLMPSQVPAVVSRYYEATVNSLSKLVNETEQFAKIGESIKDMDFNLEREARELNAIDITVATYGSVSVGDEVTTEENSTIPSNTTVYNGDGIGNLTLSNSSSNLLNNEDLVSSNSFDNVLNIGDFSNKVDVGISDRNPIYDFIPYEEVFSDENRLVFKCDEGYKVVIHIENDSIVGIEHYYDLNNNEGVTLDSITEYYHENKYLDEIIHEDNYVKVIFDVDMYQGSNLNDIKSLYVNDDKYIYVKESE